MHFQSGSRNFLMVFAVLSVAAGFAPIPQSQVLASPVYSGQVCSENVGRLTAEVGWAKDLEKAQQDAAAQGKLILWVHMVGKLDGFT
jgi:hypothetical protein